MLVQLLANAGTGVVVKNIDVAEAIKRRFDHAVAVFLLDDVDGGEDRFSAFFILNEVVDPR